jgi:heat shock protein HslJ
MKYLQLIFFCLVLAACTPANNNENKLDGTRWRLQSLNGHALQANTAITLEFHAETVEGRGGCNGYGANYTIQPENGFKVSEGAWTEKLCSEPEGVMEQEREYESAFRNVTTYNARGTTLSLANEQKGISLRYQLLPKFEVNPQDLIGKTWGLVSATRLNSMKLNAFTLRFDGSKFSGNTICRGYEGTYQAINDDLRFPYLKMTADAGCKEEDLIAEGQYIGLLGIVWQYNVSNTQLELYTDKGEKLVFELDLHPLPTPTTAMEGERPTYVDVSDCPPATQSVIESKGLPNNLIHSCKEEPVKLDTGGEVNLVTIDYGEGMDCPAGCGYEAYVGVISKDQTLIDLPGGSIENDMWGRLPLDEWKTWSTENWSMKSHAELVERNGHYGWAVKLDDYKFTRVYLRSYGNDASIGKTVYTATGEIFEYLDSSGEEVWDYSKFKFTTEEIQ